MKVSDHNSPIQLDAYVKNAQQVRQKDEPKQTVPGSPGGGDKVELSDHAKNAQKAAEQINQTTAGHEDKVRQVKMEVESGTYKVSGEQVATDMLKEAFENDIILQKINTSA